MAKLPKSFKKYFWDTNFAKIDLKKHSKYIIVRLLDLGDDHACQYLLSIYPRKLIIQTLKTRRGISARSANFWALYFGIDPKELMCFKKGFPNPPVKIWPY